MSSSGGALFVVFGVQQFFAAHRTYPLFVCTRLAVMRSHLMHLRSANAENCKQIRWNRSNIKMIPLYPPAWPKRLTNWIESHFCAGQSLVLVHFASTRFCSIPCTRFPWVWRYHFSQLLFTFVAHHFRQSSSIYSSRREETPVWFNSMWSILLFCYYDYEAHTQLSPNVKCRMEWRWCRLINFILDHVPHRSITHIGPYFSVQQ